MGRSIILLFTAFLVGVLKRQPYFILYKRLYFTKILCYNECEHYLNKGRYNMVKRFVCSIILSLFMCVAVLYLNDRYYHKAGRLLLCIRLKDPKEQPFCIISNTHQNWEINQEKGKLKNDIFFQAHLRVRQGGGYNTRISS